MRALYGSKVWADPLLYLITLFGTLLLANEGTRPWAVSLLIASAVLAVVLWGRQDWIPAFPSDITARTGANRSCLFYVVGVTIAVLVVLAADLRYAAAPNRTFGLAGILWLAGMGLLLFSAFFGSRPVDAPSSALRSIRWPTWEIAVVAGLFCVALLTRVWNLTNFPENIYPDEIMLGTVATQSYISTNRCAAVALQHAVERDRFACSLVLVRGPISEAGRDLACDVKTACRFVRGGYTCPALCIVTRNMGQIRGDSWKHDHGFQRVECSLQPPGA